MKVSPHRRTNCLPTASGPWMLLATLCLALVLVRDAAALSEDKVDGSHVDRLTFGVYAHIRSTEIFRKMAPLRLYLQKSMAAKGAPVQIELRIFSSYAGAIESLVEGEVDFVRFGPVSYVLAKQENPAIRLLAMESNDGEKHFHGVIFVPGDSPVRSVEDLRGKRFAFGDRRSTTGRYLAQAALFRAGIQNKDLDDSAYLGRHDKVAFAVAAGNYDAGATNENTYNRYAESKGLRKLLDFPCVTKPWIARSGLDDTLFRALRDVLLELRDTGALQAIKRSGLLPATDEDYDVVRQGMASAKQFDDESLIFAIYTSEKPSVVYNIARPLLDALQQKLAAERRADRILIKVFRTYQGAIDALVRGDVDFGRFGPASYVLALDRNPKLRVLAREDTAADSPRGVFIVAAGSPITGLEQLRGKTFAFGDRRSTGGRYLAQVELVKRGVSGVDLRSYSYLGRHDRVAYAVAAGNYDAGVLRDTVLRKYDVAGQVRVIGSFPVPNKVWIAREGSDDELFAVLQAGLLEMKDRRTLGFLGVAGFTALDDRDYDAVRAGIGLSEEFSPAR